MSQNNSENGSDTDSEMKDFAIFFVLQQYVTQTRRLPQQIHTTKFHGIQWVQDILAGHPDRCQRNFRMKRLCFVILCDRLEGYGLRATAEISVYEMVAIFLYTIGQNLGTRQIAERFQRSNSTIAIHFQGVLATVITMAADIIKPADPTFSTVPSEIAGTTKYYPYFRNAIGAIDGTHIIAHILPQQAQPFIGRKGYATQNVMVVCAFDLTFTFVRAGWEGTAHDSRILQSVLNDRSQNFPDPPPGQYYLVDSGYGISEGFLPPYRNVRYHIPEFHATPHQRKTRNEIFNYYHSSLRMTIERTFGIWKKKFPILKNMLTYNFPTQVKVVVATMAIHNFIRKFNAFDPDFMSYDNNPDLIPPEYLEEYEDIQTFGRGNEEHVQRNEANPMVTVRDIIRDELIQAGAR